MIILTVRIRANGSTYDRSAVRDMKRRLLDEYGFADIYLELYEEDNKKESGEKQPALQVDAQ